MHVLRRRCLTPKLEFSMGLMDTCGVHNLHGTLGLLGRLLSLTSYGETRASCQLDINKLGFRCVGD